MLDIFKLFLTLKTFKLYQDQFFGMSILGIKYAGLKSMNWDNTVQSWALLCCFNHECQ